MESTKKIKIPRILTATLLFFTLNFGVGHVDATFVPTHPPASSVPHCNAGPMQCCNQLLKSKDSKQLLAANGIAASVLAGVTGFVGAGCTPVTVAGVGSGAQCSSQTVCCQKNGFNGAIAIGCNPINVGL
ncbi:Hydrophobin-B [Leucoagaricus sp. SymC.cos]|nr:Hydrophobin-B [Leucoagaricus sp. SymC.cos]